MRPPEANVINLRPEAPMVEPERPCWGVYEHWVTNEKGRRLRPGVYWHSFKRKPPTMTATMTSLTGQSLTSGSPRP